jgi:hypothetical protein
MALPLQKTCTTMLTVPAWLGEEIVKEGGIFYEDSGDAGDGHNDGVHARP